MILFNSWEDFQDWKKDKLRKEWANTHIQFKCSICYSNVEIRASNLLEGFICRSCRKSITWSKKSKEQKEKENQRRKNTLKEKYGVDFLMESTSFKEKAKQTCLKKYGVENPSQSKEIKEKIKQHNLNKYGVESTNQIKEIKEKQLEKRKEIYKENKEKIIAKKRKTLKERYGLETFNNSKLREKTWKLKSKEEKKRIREKFKQTCLEKYGAENFVSSNLGRQKAREQWNNLTEEQRKNQKEKCQKTWQNKTEEERKEIRSKAIKKYGCYYIQTEEGRNRIIEYWKSLSVEIKKLRLEKCQETWRNKTPEEKKNIRKKSIKKYSFNLETFDSSWELAVWIYAIEHNEEIEREPCCFEYEYEGRKYSYFPDFKYKEQLIEIKGDQFFKEDGSMQNPFDHSQDRKYENKHQCALKNNVIIWNKQNIRFALNYVVQKYGKNWTKLFLISKIT